MTSYTFMLLFGLSAVLYGGTRDSRVPGNEAPVNFTCYQLRAPRLHLTVPSSEVLSRIHLPAGTALRAIEVELSGPPTQFAGEIVVYGHAAGLIAPRTEEPTILGTLHKQHHGIEKIRVSVDPPFLFVGGQAFIGVRNAPDSIRVLLVRDTTQVPCEAIAGSRQTAVYRGRDSLWNQTTLPLAIGLAVEYPQARAGGFVLDSTVDAAADINREGQPYLSAGDVNGDGLIDLAAAGLLYVNSPSGFVVLDVSTQGDHPYILFADVDGDGGDDLITMDLPCATGISSWRWQQMNLRQVATIDFSIGCITPVSTVVIAEGQTPMILVSGYVQGRAVALGVSPGAKHAVVDVTDALVLDDGVAPILLAADIDGDHYIDVVTRSASTDRILRYVGQNEFAEVARSTFDAPALDLSASTFTKARDGADRLEMPRSVSWREDPHRVMHTYTATLADDPRSNTIGRPDERPSSRHFADLDNDGSAELIEFGQGDCRSMAVFAWGDDSWRDVTHEFGLGGVQGAADGLIVDLDMDGRLDLVVDRRGRVEVRYNRLECPKATSINLYGAGTGSLVRTDRDEAIGSLVRGRGRLIEDALQVHVPQAAVDSLVIEQRRTDQQKRTRHVVEANRAVLLGSGHEVERMSVSTAHPTMLFNGESLVVRGFRSGHPAVMHVVTMSGETIVERRFDQLTEASVVPLHQMLLDLQVASGSYTVQISGAAGVSTLIITFVR